MTTWWHYLFLANLYLVLFYVFYVLLLRRETFFQLNRIYLVASAALSFVLPLVQLDWVKQLFITQRVEQTLYQANPGFLLQINAIPDDRLTVGEIIGYIYAAGLIFMLIKLYLHLIDLKRVLKTPGNYEPYSFFKVVRVDKNIPEHKIISAHEETHSRQWHSADRLFLEMLLIISWFNPIIYLYRRAVKHLHEFIADSEIVNTGTSKKQYAQLLVRQAFMAPAHQLTNTFFNHSLLKQRIIMLQKNKSKRVALGKYGLSAPLFAAMLVLSSATLSKTTFVIKLNTQADAAMDAPAAVAEHLIAANPVERRKHILPADTSITISLKEPANKEKELRLKLSSDTVPAGNKTELFTAVEQQAEPEGGMQGFYQYIGKNIHYPAEAVKAKVQGRVIVTFIVEQDGSLSDVKSLRGPGYGLDEEAVRVIASSPTWKAARQNNNPVRSQFTVPIQFALPATSSASVSATATGNQPNMVLKLRDPKKIDSVRVTENTMYSTNNTAHGSDELRIKVNSNKSGVQSTPLYILDGKEVSEIKNINPNDIESIDVIKNKAATDKYGSKGANGVVVITSKHKP